MNYILLWYRPYCITELMWALVCEILKYVFYVVKNYCCCHIMIMFVLGLTIADGFNKKVR